MPWFSSVTANHSLPWTHNAHSSLLASVQCLFWKDYFPLSLLAQVFAQGLPGPAFPNSFHLCGAYCVLGHVLEQTLCHYTYNGGRKNGLHYCQHLKVTKTEAQNVKEPVHVTHQRKSQDLISSLFYYIIHEFTWPLCHTVPWALVFTGSLACALYSMYWIELR